MKTIRTSVAAVALLAALAPASAADLLSSVTGGGLKDGTSSNTWTGFYVGINGGYGWDSQMNFRDAYTTTGGSFLEGLQTGTRPSGWFGGLTAGADYQLSSFVVGIETDLDLANIKDDSAVQSVYSNPGTPTPACNSGFAASGTAASPTCTATTGSVHSTVDWFGTLRARAGLPLGSSFLPYVTGGLAYGGVSERATNVATNLSQDTTRVGSAVGGGVEWKMTPGWSLSAEYLHIDLGSHSFGNLQPITGLSTTATSPDNQIDVARIVLKYKIGADLRHPE